MDLNRGFWRLLVVVSIAALGAGLALDAGKLWSHARIYATLNDGSTEVFETWDLVGSPPYEESPATREMVVKLVREPKRVGDFEFEEVEPGFLPSLKAFRVVRGPGAWSWEDVRFTPIAAGIVLILWAGFFAVRWIARGFVPQQTR